MSDELRNGIVVWFRDAGLEVRGIVNGDPYDVVASDGITRTIVPVHQPQTNQNLLVQRGNIYRVGEAS